MFGIDDLLDFAREVVEDVIRQITGQADIVENMVTAPVRGFVQQVVGGAWQGQGADKFVEEMNSVFIPACVDLAESLTSLNFNLGSAMDILDAADDAVNGIVNGVVDVFSSIF
ncbi:MAG TPA: WXG100 family type VII secretion target [Anaerolineaceae bacterium]|mgnify:CR=1 FL=1|nr:WXG100 family type VII secretion target [Anaerolineaceae bacterium]HPN51110.1 WXG100 family type VII secretion target [Anaerolineaceae bacterium]